MRLIARSAGAPGKLNECGKASGKLYRAPGQYGFRMD
jgi:hypothetical protein